MNDIKPDANGNTQKSIDSKFGTYKDPASTLSDADRFPNTKEGPQPSPFKSLRDG
jgi:hypothetical protein